MESPSIRIYGPYQHNGGWRCQIEVNGRRRWGPMAKTAQRAEKLAVSCTDQIQAAHPLTVMEALDRYRGHLARKGNKPTSIENTLGKLHRFFRSVLADVLVRLTKSRAATLYDKLSREPSERTGKPLSADSHRNMLAEAKTFLSWCAEQRWIGGNPLASVKGVGSVGTASRSYESTKRESCEPCVTSKPPMAMMERSRCSSVCSWDFGRVRS